MRFEEALKAMREGKKCRVARLSPNYLFLVNGEFFVNDGLYNLPIGHIKTEYILSDDWEVVDE